MERRCIGEVISVLRAVGGMEVGREVGVILREKLGEGTPLGRVQFHVIAIDIEILRVRTCARSANRSVLGAPIREGYPFVPVRVQDWCDEDHERIEKGGMHPLRDLAEEDEKHLFPLDFAARWNSPHVFGRGVPWTLAKEKPPGDCPGVRGLGLLVAG
jgi:hypothetical protein